MGDDLVFSRVFFCWNASLIFNVGEDFLLSLEIPFSGGALFGCWNASMIFNVGDDFLVSLGISFSGGDLFGCWNASMIFNVGVLVFCFVFVGGGLGVPVSPLFCC